MMMFVTEAVAFINKNAHKPFFIYLATTTPHEGFLAKSKGSRNPVPWPYANCNINAKLFWNCPFKFRDDVESPL